MIFGAALGFTSAVIAAAAASDAPVSSPAPRWELPEVEIRADPLPDPLGPFPLVVRRIGRAAVERRPGGDLRDVLLPVAGLRVTTRGAPWAASSVSLRGSTSDQVLVLVDGRRRNVAQGGGVDLAGLPLDSVEEVEVFRGGASALFGSDAVGGAIHVRTRPPEPGRWRLRTGTGSYGERSLEGRGAVGLRPSWNARIGGRFFEAAGDYAFDDDRRDTARTVANGDVRRAGADVRIDGVSGPLRLRLDADGSNDERGVPGSAEFPTPTARLESDRFTIGARAEGAPGPWQPAIDVSYLRRSRRYSEPGAAFGAVDESHRNARVEGDISLVRLAGPTAVQLAGGASADRLRSTTDGARGRDAGNARMRVTHDARLGDTMVRWMAAARADAVRGFAPFLTPRVGVAAEVVPGRLSFTASAGLSYRAPSFDELFWPPRATAAGNEGLRAERGRDLDGGVDLHGLPGAARAAVQVFVREVDDLIQWIPGASGIWRPHNVGRVRIAGVESEAQFETAPLLGVTALISASGTFLDARDRTGEPNVDGRELVYRPRWSGTGSILLRHSTLGELESVGRFVDDVFVTRANTKSLPGYLLADVRWRRPVGSRLTLDVAVTNVTDRRARDFRDYPLPGRSWKLGVAWDRRAR